MTFFLQNIVNALQWGSFYALIALGYSMVYSILMLFNFAHGDIFMVGAYIGLGIATALLAIFGSGAAAILPGTQEQQVLSRLPAQDHAEDVAAVGGHGVGRQILVALVAPRHGASVSSHPGADDSTLS